MLNKKSSLLYGSLILFFFCCTAYTRLSFTFDPAVAIPPDFATNTDTMLVENSYHMLGYSGYVKGYLKRYYTGPYKMVLKKDLEKYPVDKYRYLFDYEYSTENKIKQKGVSGSPKNGFRNETRISYNKLFITDRITGKEYYMENDEQHYSRLLKKYLLLLEKAKHGLPLVK